MRLSERAIEMPRLVLLGAVLICALGVAALLTLPKERTPRIKLPVIVVAVPNPGATADTNERNITRKLEEEIAATIDGLRDEGAIVSQSVHGAVVFQIVFDDGTKVDDAKQEVESVVNRVKAEFPPPARADPGPRVNDIAFEDWPVIQAFVAGGTDGAQRRRIAERLKSQIEKLPGVSGVDLFGGREQEVRIEVNPHLLVVYGFSYEHLHRAVRRANEDAPTGEIDTAAGSKYRVRAGTRLASLEEIRNVPIGLHGGKPMVLADVAKVRLGHKKRTSMASYGGQDCVVVLARPKTDIDVLTTAKAVQSIVDVFDTGDPAVAIGTVRSQAREIGYMLTQLGMSAIYGTILVILILWIFLGWRNAGLIGISVPFAILATAAFMWITKRTLMPDLAINNMTLFAMILVVGMVVDGCIIVGENIFRHREGGAAPLSASTRGIREVGPSLICAYLTTFAAFAPMFLVGGVMGDFLELLPVVVLFALCSAMLVDHFVLPVLSLYFMKVPARAVDGGGTEGTGGTGAGADATVDIREAEAAVGRSRAARVYGDMIRYALKHRLLVLAMVVVTTLMPIALYAVGAIGVEFFPESDYAIVEVYYELPLGSSMEQKTSEVGRVIEAAVLRAVRPEEWYRPSAAAPRVKPVTTIGEPAALNIRLDRDHGTGPEFGMVYVELELAGKRERSLKEIRRAILDQIPPLPDVVVNITSPEEGPPVGAPVVVRVLGREQTSIESLAERAAEIERMLRAVPGTYDVKSDFRLRPEIVVSPDRMQASLFNMDSARIGTSLNFALDGVKAGQVDFGGDEDIDLRILNQPSHRDQFQDLANLPLLSDSGHLVTLEQVARVERTRSANIIRHYDRRRVVNIRCALEDGVLVDNVRAALVNGLEAERRNAPLATDRGPAAASNPTGTDANGRVLLADESVIIEFGGENTMRDDAMHDLWIALLVAFAAMLIILVLKFNSFVQPLIILFSVPLSLVGVAIGLMICGFHFSVAAMIGVLALSGIVVNDAIVLVDFINRLRDTGVSLEKAVVYAGQLRVRPIFLTTVTTIGALLPLALNLSGGGEFWQPLTVTVMFGLGFATLLQLFIIPLACYSFDHRRRPSLLDPARYPKLAGPQVAGPDFETGAVWEL